jgi:SNF2 family DNA or RNA helicase
MDQEHQALRRNRLVRNALKSIKPSKKDAEIISSLILQTPWTSNQQEYAIKLIEKYIPGVNIFNLQREQTKEEMMIIRKVYVDEQVKTVDKIKNGMMLNIPVPLKTELYNHQKTAFSIGNSLDACALFCEVGTGKTLAAIAIAGNRFLQNQVRRLLVIAPVSVLHVWSLEFEKHAEFPYNLSISTISKARNKFHELNVFCISYESAWRYTNEIHKWKPDMVICDESQKIKSIDSNRSKFLHDLGKQIKYKMIMSGTPVTQSTMDVFSQYKFLDTSIFGDSYTKFKANYCVMGGYEGKQVVGYKNLDKLRERAHSIAYRVKKSDVLDLPEFTDQIIYCELTESKEFYEQAVKELKACYAAGNVTRFEALSKLLQLSQITGGNIPVIREDGTKEIVAIGHEKLSLLRDFIQDLPEYKKFIVVAHFLPEIRNISSLLDELNITNHVINGSVSPEVRGDIVHKFQDTINPQALILQSQIGVGLTLTAADLMIFYSNDYSYANYEQTRGRIHRAGQKNKCLYVNLVCKNTIDEKILSALKRKEDFAIEIIDFNKKA